MTKNIKSKYFRKRGVQSIAIDFDGEKIKVILDIPTNLEHNELMEQFTSITPEGTADIRMGAFAEEQMVKFVVDLPFDVPVNSEMTIFKGWKETTEDEKRFAINCMDDSLHDAINKSIVKASNISEADRGN